MIKSTSWTYDMDRDMIVECGESGVRLMRNERSGRLGVLKASLTAAQGCIALLAAIAPSSGQAQLDRDLKIRFLFAAALCYWPCETVGSWRAASAVV